DAFAERRDGVGCGGVAVCGGGAAEGEERSHDGGGGRECDEDERVGSHARPTPPRGVMSHVEYRFVDCRWALDDPAAGRDAYRSGHIPGAVFVDLERDLSAPAGPEGRHPLPPAAAFAAAMARAGIGDETFVVAYGSLGGAERLWWLLRHFGHGACAVIDLAAWRGPLAAGEGTAEPATFTVRERTGDTISRDELAARRGELVVVDARLPARFRGEPNPVDRVPGRIPGAR